MRYIDINQLTKCKPKNWDQNSANWLRELSLAENKSEKIKQIGNKWKDFKIGFIKQFGDKCWYSEVKRLMTDFDVDHFRPKGTVKNSDGTTPIKLINGVQVEHPGYWWLAFEAKNYRYSCIFANRPRDKGGKHDFFPLMREDSRVWSKCGINEHCNERITLLDPCSKTDVKLISYDKIPGTIQSRYAQSQNPDAYLKVRESCKRYNLNHKTIKGARKKVIKDVQDALQFLSNMWNLPDEYKEPFLQHMEVMQQKLIESCDRKSEFSAAAVAFVKPFKQEPWLADIRNRLDLSD